MRATTSDIIFKVRMASFTPMTSQTQTKMLKEFSEFIKRKGHENNFLVWTTNMEIETDSPLPGRFYEVEK